MNHSTARITVDVPATLLSLAQYCIVLATALVTAVIALDSQRAADVLYMLVSITTVRRGGMDWFDGGATDVRSGRSPGCYPLLRDGH